MSFKKEIVDTLQILAITNGKFDKILKKKKQVVLILFFSQILSTYPLLNFNLEIMC